MVVRRTKQGDLEGVHFYTTWFVKKLEYQTTSDTIVLYWTEAGEWVPWDADAMRYPVRKDAENILAGFVLTAQDREEFELEVDEDRHRDDDPPAYGICPECAKQADRRDPPITDTDVEASLNDIDGRVRQDYDEGEVADDGL